eukprot:2156020-Pyramimonas_sp.AAC.1
MSPPPGKMSSAWPMSKFARMDPMLRKPNRPGRSLPDPLTMGAVKLWMAALPCASVTAMGYGGAQLMGALLGP